MTTDLHQFRGKWEALIESAEREQPAFILVAGDILPKDGGITRQREFFPQLRKMLQAIRDQPLLGCSGHIHESPHQPGGRWSTNIGHTLWVQPGQVDRRLHYVTLDITDTYACVNMRHSVFGAAREGDGNDYGLSTSRDQEPRDE
jgi:Icc-related predicted phosphoesterase